MNPATKPSNARSASQAPTQKEFSALYNYDPLTGIFTLTTARGGKQPGDKAGSINPQGYVLISAQGRLWMGHQCAWLAHYGEWPQQMIDHINKLPADNRICNLRLSNYSENKFNCAKSESLSKGISWHRANKKYIVQFWVNKKKRYFGTFPTYEEALTCALQVRASLGLA